MIGLGFENQRQAKNHNIKEKVQEVATSCNDEKLKVEKHEGMRQGKKQ